MGNLTYPVETFPLRGSDITAAEADDVELIYAIEWLPIGMWASGGRRIESYHTSRDSAGAYLRGPLLSKLENGRLYPTNGNGYWEPRLIAFRAGHNFNVYDA